jgi:hypothetical protein
MQFEEKYRGMSASTVGNWVGDKRKQIESAVMQK